MNGRYNAVGAGIFILVVINFFIVFRHYDSEMETRHFSSTPKEDVQSKALMNEDNVDTYSIYKYDQNHNFLVVEKGTNNEDTKEHNSPEGEFLLIGEIEDQLGKPDDSTNVKIIEDYDYIKMFHLVKDQYRIDAMADPQARIDTEASFRNSFIDFFEELLNVIRNNAPNIGQINNDDHYRQAKEENKYPNRDGRVMLYGGNVRENYLEEPVRTKDMLANYLRLSDTEFNELQASHRNFLEQMPKGFPEQLLKLNKFNYFMKGDGVVFLGGDSYNQLVLLSLKRLRSLGSKLPVEVIIPYRGDFDIDFCYDILPTLDAKCKIMSDYLPRSLLSNLKGYQFKNVAIMISSFERVLYLDADNIPLRNTDLLFSNQPFTDHHLVIWPDFWRRSTAPSYYQIADINVNEKSRVRNSYFKGDDKGSTNDESKFSYHDCEGAIPEASSETGQILINKKVHAQTLMLSMYYNWFGPNFFYPLLSQGAAGEGDKETFIAAAHKLGLPYYQVKEFNREFGPLNDKGRHEIFAMGQYDPILDFIQSKEDDSGADKDINYDFDKEPTYAKNDIDTERNNYAYRRFKSSNLMFLHANWPKFNLAEMFLSNSYGRGPEDGQGQRRLYNKELTDTLDYDVELVIFKELQWWYCDLKINLQKVPDFNSDERKKICEKIAEHKTFLIDNPY